MTCIVGVEHAGKVYIGGDRAQANEGHIAPMSAPKVFTKNNIAVGYTTSFRFGNLIQYRLAIPGRRLGQSLEEYMYGDFVEAVRSCLKEGGYTRIENSVEEGGTALIGVEGKVFKLQDNFSLTHNGYGYEAVGSGMYAALGSLHTTSKDGLFDAQSQCISCQPELRCKLALQAAIDLTPFVCAPIDIISV